MQMIIVKKNILGPYIGRSNFDNTMINPQDLLIQIFLFLDLISHSVKNSSQDGWKNNLSTYKIPNQFSVY